MDKMRETIGKAAGKLKKAGATLAGDKGLFRELKEQHAEVSVLMKQVRAGGESARRQLFPKIRENLLAHARAEQSTLYEALKHSEHTRPQIDDSFREHQEMEQILQRLVAMPIESDQWKLTFDELVETVEHHVRDEENELFPLSKKVLSDSQIQDIERRFKAVHESEMRLLQAQ